MRYTYAYMYLFFQLKQNQKKNEIDNNKLTLCLAQKTLNTFKSREKLTKTLFAYCNYQGVSGGCSRTILAYLFYCTSKDNSNKQD